MVGDKIVRNSETMYRADYWSDNKVIRIKTGAKFEVIEETYLYSIIENKMGDKYKVGPTDLRKFFDGVSGKTPKIEETKSCSCDSLELRDFGCRCGCIPNKLEERLQEMWTGISGEK